MSNYMFSGFDTVALAEQYKTPLYVMSEDIIRENIYGIKAEFEAAGAAYCINFAGKSFLNTAMCRIVDDCGICLDVSSGGELYTALRSGLDASRICMHGNNKSEEELLMAIENGVGRIVVDNENELVRLDQLTRSLKRSVKILFRVTPGISAHTHELIQTATEDSKFGIPIKLARKVIAKTLDMPFITTIGIHCHIGSQIVDEKPFVVAMDKMLELYQKLLKDGIPLTELNLGGGFGIAYLPSDEAFDVKNHIPKMVDHIKDLAFEKHIPMPTLCVEPGRYISATAGITLYTIGVVKKIPGIKTYVCVDGGMADNPRPALYDAVYEAVICNEKADDSPMKTVTVSGKACETDQLIEEIPLPDPQVGDILAVKHTGAYNYTMSSNYNRLPRPAVVLLSQGRSGVIVERESYADLVTHDRIPEWLS